MAVPWASFPRTFDLAFNLISQLGKLLDLGCNGLVLTAHLTVLLVLFVLKLQEP